MCRLNGNQKIEHRQPLFLNYVENEKTNTIASTFAIAMILIEVNYLANRRL